MTSKSTPEKLGSLLREYRGLLNEALVAETKVAGYNIIAATLDQESAKLAPIIEQLQESLIPSKADLLAVQHAIELVQWKDKEAADMMIYSLLELGSALNASEDE